MPGRGELEKGARSGGLAESTHSGWDPRTGRPDTQSGAGDKKGGKQSKEKK